MRWIRIATHSERAGLSDYALAVLVVGVAALMTWLLGRVLTEVFYLPFVLAVVVGAAIGGLWPGLLATIVAALCVDFLFTPPIGRFSFDSPVEMTRQAIFVAGGAAVSLLAERMHRALRRLREENSQRRADEQALERERAFLRRVIDAVPAPVFVKDWEGHFLLANEAVAQAYGTTVRGIIGKTDADFNANQDELRHFQNDDREVISTRKPKLIPMEKVSYADGREHWLSTVKVPLVDADGSCTRVLGVATDISGLKRVEEQLQQAKEAAESANAAKDHFLAVLSHELRNPLAPMLATVSLLREVPALGLDAEAREHLEVIQRNAELEARLIDDLLDVTRIVRGKVELDKRPTNLCTVIHRAVEVCQPDLDGRELHFGVDAQAGLYTVNADAARLQQVFWNLLKNAIKFTAPSGCVGIRVRSDGEGHVVIEVNDSGVGIEPQVLPRIFNAFEQGERGTTRQFGGLGLGLAISKAMVEMHGGTIEARSEGKGKGGDIHRAIAACRDAIAYCGGAADAEPAVDRRRSTVENPPRRRPWRYRAHPEASTHAPGAPGPDSGGCCHSAEGGGECGVRSGAQRPGPAGRQRT